MDSCFSIDSQSPSPSECYRAYTTISTAPPKKRAGRTKFRETRHPVFKGVRRRGSNGDRWVCEVRDPNSKSRIWLGTFPTAEMAARAHDVAAMALRGRKACLNFADSAWRLAVPESASHKDIQQAAAVAAEMFRPSAEAKSGTACQEQMLRPSASSEPDVAHHEQSSSSESSDSDAVKISPTTVPIAVELGSLLDAVEFGRDYLWDALLAEPSFFNPGYCTDDPAVDVVADVPLWSYYI